jgi:VIT1/CCC1 family predicted Fe2+/Mn2+ transporter
LGMAIGFTGIVYIMGGLLLLLASFLARSASRLPVACDSR